MQQRGALLIEAALAVGIGVSLIGLTVSINAEQARRTDAVTIGSEKRLILDAARNYVQDKSEDLIEDLFQAAVDSGGPAQLVVSAQDLVSTGYIPESFEPGVNLSRLFDQQYAMLIRPVFQDDPDIPAAVLSEIDMDPFGTGAIDPRFIDGDPSNGELGLEAVLFTLGGDPVPAGQAGRALSAAERINAGYLNAGIQSRGNGGTMNFNIAGFEDFEDYDDIAPGNFASPVALGSVGVIGAGPAVNIPELRETFLRCVDVLIGTPAFAECLSAPRNEVFTNIILRPYDSNDDGTNDVFPTITGATRIMCDNALGNTDDPVDENVFLIDCQTTAVNGILDVTGPEIQFGGETLVQTEDIAGTDETVVTADRIAMRMPGGGRRDLSTIPTETFQVPARDVIELQDCPDTDIDGTAISPRIDASVTALLDPWGRAISGSFALAERGTGTSDSWTPSASGDRWMVRILYTLNADFCEASFTNTLDIRDTFSNPNDSGSTGNFVTNTERPDIGQCSDSSGFADVYELHPVGAAVFGAATVTLSCRP